MRAARATMVWAMAAAVVAGSGIGKAPAAGAADLPPFITRPSHAPAGAVPSPAAAPTVGPNVNITNKAGAQSETTVAVDPLDPGHVLSASNDLSSGFTDTMHAYESFDGGQTWQESGLDLLPTFCYDPWVDFSLDYDPIEEVYRSVPLVAYECAPTTGTDQRIAYRAPGSATWTTITFSRSLTGTFPDRDQVVADTTPSSPLFGSVYVGYDNAGASNAAHVLYTRDLFPDAGAPVWRRSPKINDQGRTIGVNVAVTPDGTIYATWLDFDNQRLYIDRSTDGGTTWGTDRVVTTFRTPTQTFFITIPPQAQRGVLPLPFTVGAPADTAHAGRVYVSYFDLPSPAGAGTDIFVRYSDDGGVTWSAEKTVNDNDGLLPSWTFHQAISVAPDGTVGVSFYDTRNDPRGLAVDRYAAFSADGGNTWGTNLRVSTVSSDESHPFQGDGNQYGDYQGLDAGPAGDFYSVWCDSRTGAQAEEMFGASIVVDGAGAQLRQSY